MSDSGGGPYQDVANELRARLKKGVYRVGQQLPPQRQLADEFGVARDTVVRVLHELAEEGLIESRRGSGTRVRAHPETLRAQQQIPSMTQDGRSRRVTLGPLIGAAFETPHVSLDVFTLTSESLDAHIRVQAERVRAGEITPESVQVRMLLPDASTYLPYPRVKADPEDERPQERLRAISDLHSQSLQRVLGELATEGLVKSVSVEIRTVPLAPAFKVYLLNGREALIGPYQVLERRINLLDDTPADVVDVLGLGSTLAHHAEDDDAASPGSVFVASLRDWFTSLWDLLATPPQPKPPTMSPSARVRPPV
ncbi:winged helix-turn-helix domain-containing protein [Streptomyces indicus]|uniref:winged helix-turn-helix domain-containing protein n=1 Tax=Streptomyces indicus TaxID=417292 RepID=UPI001FE548E3|nr:GntR family transcriptional regulator [Streptomyces indicus]